MHRLKMGDRHEDNEDMGAEKRALRNAAERKRCDTIKDAFLSLKNSVPSLKDGKSKICNRQQILTQTIDYIRTMKQQNARLRLTIDHLNRENRVFESEIKRLNVLLATANYSNKSSELALCASETDDSDVSN